MRIVGLDLSLTATGVAIVSSRVTVHTVTSKGSKDATLDQRAERLAGLVGDTLYGARCGALGVKADLVVIEQPAFSRTTGHHHDRSGLWWLVVDAMRVNSFPVVEVTPSGLKKYATGRGNAGKDEVLLAVARRFPDVEVTNNNEADALVLAAMGARYLGRPIDDMPKSHLTALDAVRWSEVTL